MERRQMAVHHRSRQRPVHPPTDPERYAPACNGHCANALSLGEGLIKTDGTHWQIFEDQLYTFYATRGRDRWFAGDFKENKKEADKA